jgi:dolichol-phosphate mannosyltransferase
LSDSLVIIPTYNERENAESIIRKVFSLNQGFDILIVDDGSPDGTAAIVKNLQTTFPASLHLLERSGKQGLGTAYIAGFKWALAKQYAYVFEMDADFSHNPEDLHRLRQACVSGSGDLSVGSRYVKGGSVKDWSTDRILMSYLASIYVNLILWLGVRDSTAGFKCYRRIVLETIDLNTIQFVGYAFQIEMKYKAKRLGFKIKEVPITFVDRRQGVSKMNMGIFKEAFWGVLRMRFMKVRPAKK